MKLLIKLNIIFFASYALLTYLGSLESFLAFRLANSLIGVIVTFLLGGINLVAIIQLVTSRKFNLLESLSIASACSFALMPILLALELSTVHFKSSFQHLIPALNSFIIFIALLIVYFTNKKPPFPILSEFNSFSEFFHSLVLNYRKFFIFTLGLIINLLTVLFVVRAYYPLPDFDPYYWLSHYINNLEQGTHPDITGYRSLFYYLFYIFNQGAHIDAYAYLKYVMPCLSLFIFLPASLVASRYKNFSQSIIILLFTSLSASTILYLLTPMPQAIVIIFSYYFLFFIIYSWISQNNFFYYLAGTLIFIAFFYQETAILIFLPWLIVTSITYWEGILNWSRKNKLSLFLLFLLALSCLDFFIYPLNFMHIWSSKVLSWASFNSNFKFPAYYVNVDRNSMGWPGASGVTKYYVYYTGITFFLVIMFLSHSLITDKNYRKSFLKKIISSKELLVLSLSFLLFFSISELFPRVPGFALLPERAWIFGGIMAGLFIFLLFDYYKEKGRLFYYLIIATLIINIGGALYINNLKKYIITTAQIDSAKWIKENLPCNRLIFSNNQRLIRFYSQSATLSVPSNFFFDAFTYKEILSSHGNQQANLVSEYEKYTNDITNFSQELKKIGAKEDVKKVGTLINIIKNRSEEMNKKIKLDSEASPKPSLYIYYSKDSNKNPYINRPYIPKEKKGAEFIFDKQPENFQRIYNDNKNGIVIWKIL